MISKLRVFAQAAKIELAGRMAYRGDFFITAVMILITDFILPMVTFLIYGTGASFPGWSLYEAVLIQGIFLLARGLAFCLFFGLVWNTLDRVREGTFDLLLIRPQSALTMAIVTALDFDNVGRIIGGIATCTIALVHLPFPSGLQWLQFTILFVLSLAMLFAFTLFMSGSVFKWVGNSRVYEIFDSLVSFGLYPRSIFSKSFQSVITIVIPVAMIGFFPASVLLGKPTEGIVVAAIACVVFLGGGLLFWRRMLAAYTSAGG